MIGCLTRIGCIPDMNTLNHRIDIEARQSGEDELGQPIEIWSLVASVWADVRHLSGVSAIKSGADVSVVQASVRIRHRAGLNAGMRVTHAGAHYDVQAVLPDGRRQYVDLVCRAVA